MKPLHKRYWPHSRVCLTGCVSNRHEENWPHIGPFRRGKLVIVEDFITQRPLVTGLIANKLRRGYQILNYKYLMKVKQDGNVVKKW